MNRIDAPSVSQALRDGNEIAFLDVREPGQHGESHPLRAINVPYSVLEARIEARVPRRSARVVLLDEGDGVAERAAGRLEAMGYSDVSVLEGGDPAWGAAGLEVYKGVNVPSKAFGEVVEHALHTPSIEPAELDRMARDGEDFVIVDGRTPEEFARMSIPGGMSVPNAELVYRIHDIAPEPGTTVVVNCAGRTRSIIGAQTLRNAGVANRVVALRGGTMAWRLSGFELDHGAVNAAPEPSAAGLERANAYAEAMRERYGIERVDTATVEAWRADPGRSTYLFDVRSPEEFEAGHWPGAVSAPGGQLVQATDQWCAVWGARLVLADEGSGVRATTAAHWLRQMGWDACVLAGAPDAAETGPTPKPEIELGAIERLDPNRVAGLLESGTAVAVDVDASQDYRDGHLPGARWGTRARIDRVAATLPEGCTAVLYSEHEARARLAAIDLSETLGRPAAVLRGGREAWRAEGLPLESSPDRPADAERIDYLFFVHDRHHGNDTAAREYLAWEENLPAQLAREGEDGFALVK